MELFYSKQTGLSTIFTIVTGIETSFDFRAVARKGGGGGGGGGNS